MPSPVPDRAQIVADISPSNAGHLPDAQRQLRMQAFRADLQALLNGLDAMRTALQAPHAPGSRH